MTSAVAPAATSAAALFEVTGLSCQTTADPAVGLVHDVGFDVGPGEVVSVIGESGSGKTMASLAVLGLLPRGVRATAGRVRLGDRERSVGEVDRAGFAAVFQNAREALNPTMKIGRQIDNVLRVHGTGDGDARRARAEELLRRCGVPGAANVMRLYPHQLSGGMCQRVMIAMAIAARPRLLIADEPTTALDMTVQAQIIALLREVIAETGCGVVLITHDLGVVAELADRVVVLLGGRVMERTTVGELFDDPLHPYSRFLLDPRAFAGSGETVPVTTGACPFAARCPDATERCAVAPPLRRLDDGRAVACVLHDGPAEGGDG